MGTEAAGEPGRLAGRGADPNRLLAGENPDSEYPEDAEHWLQVYGELIEFKRRALAMSQEALAALQPEAQDELKEIDIPLLELELDRLQARHRFWGDRRRDLAGPSGERAGNAGG